jgi:copper chaperone CopZ
MKHLVKERSDMMIRAIFWTATVSLLLVGAVWAENQPKPVLQVEAQGTDHTIIQIGGRMCEYRRDEVEGALRRFDAVRQVEFLNNHGTVLVRFQSNAVRPEQLAQAVERTLVMGWNCKAWVERGG